MGIYCYTQPYMALYGYIWLWTCIWVFGHVLGTSGLVFWVSGLVFWMSGLVFWLFGLVFGCLDLYLCVWTFILDTVYVRCL